MTKLAYETQLGKCYESTIEDFLDSQQAQELHGQVSLILTSPPFPLNRKKKYGNKLGEDYLNWISSLAPRLKELLTEDGSIVIEIGNSWEPEIPVMSTLPLKALLGFLETGDLNLCQQFIWYNTAKLPSPVQWVNIERTRVKDSFTNIWWMGNTPNPKANNKNVLAEYSKSMKKLLEKQNYNAGARPSEHVIGGKSFLTDNGGAIPDSILVGGNTQSNSSYQKYCKQNELELHPARMPYFIPEFFIKFLTDPGDIVLDPFGGSNTTGEAAENLGRRWIVTEANPSYIEGSKGRFDLNNLGVGCV